MGVLSEIVIANQSDARAIAKSHSPSREWQGFFWKGLDPVVLSSLWSILKGETPNVETVVQQVDRFRMVQQVSEDGPWLFSLPREFRDLLANISNEPPAIIGPVEQAWGATEELEHWSPADVEECLGKLADLASSAALEDKDLFLWICL
jgi:hypothetical protein